MLVNQISVFVENKAGRLSEITTVLSKNNIDIRALSIADTTNYGILRMIVSNTELAEKALKDAGLTVSITKVIAIGIEDKPGALSNALGFLSNAGVTVEYMYAFISRSEDLAYLILRVDNNEKAVKILTENNYHIFCGDEVYGM